jgi:hypothetical protein
LEPVRVRGVLPVVIFKPAWGPIVTVTVVVPVVEVNAGGEEADCANDSDAVRIWPRIRSCMVFRGFFIVLMPL